MREFDLAAAKKGEPVCLKDGSEVRIICFDFKDKRNPIIGLVNEDGLINKNISESILCFDEDGYCYGDRKEYEGNLMMVSDTPIDIPAKKPTLYYCKGDSERGEEVIETLKNMGGSNEGEFGGYSTDSLYYIDSGGKIDSVHFSNEDAAKLVEEFCAEIKL